MNKLEKLKELLRSYKRVAVAFSGGVDSAFLLKAAADTLDKENVIAVTLMSNVITEEEREDAERLTSQLDAQHIICNFNVFDIEGFKENPKDRCYICKKKIFSEIISIAEQRGFKAVLDGTNYDDIGDYRPGMKALKELGVLSPLKECEITKQEIRELSKDMKLFTWSRPSLACLASRIPYDEEITEEKLRRVEKAERYLRSLGYTQLRVRCHGNIARIELLYSEMPGLFDINIMNKMNNELKALGFDYVTIDLGGYRTGSLNEAIKSRIY